jgi:3',5'-cyclic AMP phosphodiesterase CpdA
MGEFGFIQITDHHLGEGSGFLRHGFATNYSFFTVLHNIATTTAKRADFILSTGDMVDPPTEAAYRYFKQALGIQQPVSPPGPLLITTQGLEQFLFYMIPGNHDDRELMRRQFFSVAPGFEWMNITFVHKGVQFICVDWGDSPKATVTPGMLAVLEKALFQELPSIIISHHAVIPIGIGWLDNFVADEVDSFWYTLTRPQVRSKILGILCGHAHITYDHIQSGIPVLGLRSTSYTFGNQQTPAYTLEPPQYRYCVVRNGELASRIYEVPLPQQGRLDIQESDE